MDQEIEYHTFVFRVTDPSKFYRTRKKFIANMLPEGDEKHERVDGARVICSSYENLAKEIKDLEDYIGYLIDYSSGFGHTPASFRQWRKGDA